MHPGKSGKSTLARQLGKQVPVIFVDRLLRPERAKGAVVPLAHSAIDTQLQSSRSIKKMWSDLRENEEVQEYVADIIALAVRQCQFVDTIIVDGHCVDLLERRLVEKLGYGFKCWSVAPGSR